MDGSSPPQNGGLSGEGWGPTFSPVNDIDQTTWSTLSGRVPVFSFAVSLLLRGDAGVLSGWNFQACPCISLRYLLRYD